MTTKHRLAALALLALAATSPGLRAQQTQMDDNQRACNELAVADKRLNAAYQKVLAVNRKNTVFVARFRAAQRAWVAFRDAEMAAVFPAKDKRLEYGSAFPMCDCDVRAELTTQRAERLEGWLNAQEGDVCAGSRTVAGQRS